MPEQDAKDRPPHQPVPPRGATVSMWRYAGIGLDLAAAVGGLTLAGYGLDRWLGRFPRYTVIGAVLGLLGGMYNLIRQSLSVTREMKESESESQKRPPKGGLQ
jgi:hypothetical protein